MKDPYRFRPFKLRRVCRAEKRGKVRYGRCIGITNNPDGTRKFSVVFGNRPDGIAEDFRKVSFCHPSVEGVSTVPKIPNRRRTPSHRVDLATLEELLE